ncbi:MAG: asparagine synthase (glutamine-hydrolyzing) [Chitinophagales bacterium]|nr:asparagine synthase (glutamine-hydrolyzing) [Chitinophagales bacterium]
MCGIAGFVDYSKKLGIDDLAEMKRKIAHRGPDGEGIKLWIKPNACFGMTHTRLSILDLSQAASQPMSSEDEELHIVFNGEIYNFQTLKKELIELGFGFKTQSDTEVLLRGYEIWGKNIFRRLEGMFSLVIYDFRKGKVLLVRDTVGTKPLYLFESNDCIAFSSTLDALMPFGNGLDTSALYTYLELGYIPAPYSIYQNIQKVLPATIVSFDISTQKKSVTYYRDVATFHRMPKLSLTYEEAKIELRNRMIEAFDYRMVSDVPVGVFLSGGYDSSLLTAVLARKNNDLNTFSIGFEEDAYDEAPFARQISSFLGTNHHEQYFTWQAACDQMSAYASAYDEPFADISALPTLLLSNFAAKKVKVALGADGADELFAGYTKYDYLLRIYNKTKYLPKFINKGIGVAISPLLLLNSHKIEKARRILQNTEIPNLMRQMNGNTTISQIKALLPSQNIGYSHGYHDSESDAISPLSQMLLMDYSVYLPDDIMVKLDRATMWHGLEGREPMLDTNLIEFAARLPDEYKYKDGIKKRILKDMTHDIIPKKLMDRPKMGFGLPFDRLYRHGMRQMVFDTLREDTIQKQGFLSPQTCMTYLSAYDKGQTSLSETIYRIFAFTVWAAHRGLSAR